jgi:LmbE family N-acetylglucosaminyl deacetylase
VDFHPEHRLVAHAVARALATRYAGREGPRVRVFQLQVPLTSVLVNRVVGIGSLVAVHAAALEAHASQYGSIVRSVRQKHYAARFHGLAGLAEEFWEMSARAYGALHAEHPDRWTRPGFRGVRYAAWGDPLGYVVGRAERRRLRRAVAEVG